MTSPQTTHRDYRIPQDLEPAGLVVVGAGVSDPSSTRLLAERITQKSLDLLREAGAPATASFVELGPLAVDIARATVSGFPGEQVQAAIDRLASADALIAATPVYKAGISGLFKSFVDLLDDDLLVAKPVLLAATAGSSRHALVIDEQMRPLFAYLRAFTLPTSVFAAPEDWATTELGGHIDRAATELAVTLHAGVGRRIADRAWSGYQHQFAGNATRAQRTAADVDFTSPLMRLAAGGTSSVGRGTGPLVDWGELDTGARNNPRRTANRRPSTRSEPLLRLRSLGQCGQRTAPGAGIRDRARARLGVA